VVSIRGSRPEDVLVLLDGVPLNDPVTGRADLSVIPTSTLHSATLLRGAASTSLGSGAGAGALLLTSRRVTGTGGGLGLRLESLGGRGLDMEAGTVGRAGRVGMTLSVSEAENEYDFVNSILPGSPVEKRRNADFRSVNSTVTAGVGALRGSVRFDASERGVPGRMGTSLYDSARAEDRAWTTFAGLETSRARTSASWRHHTLMYRDNELVTGSSQQVDEFRLAANMRTGGRVPVTVGARLTRETVRGDGIEGSPGRTVVGLQIASALSAGDFRIDPALAMDVSDGVTAISPQIGLTWAANPSTRVWGRAGRGFRLPTFGDLYFASQYLVRANPDVSPERIVLDAELGAAGSWKIGGARLEGETALWARRTEDPIVWLASAVAVWSPRNLEHLDSRGLEVALGLAAPEAHFGWRIQVAGTLERNRVGFGSNRNALPYQPAATARLTVQAWRRGTGGRVDLRHTGARTTSVAGTRRLDPFTTVDVSLSQSLGRAGVGLSFLARIENPLHQRYELIELFPEPGRRLVLRFEGRKTRE
jgi:outer membrane cobalamin receptor